MSKNFLNALKTENNFTETENGATALKSTLSSLVDLFGTIGSLRTRSEQDIEAIFSKAFAEDKLLATKMLFYARNIRGGLGERRTFKVILKFLAKVHPDIVKKNLNNIPCFGRFDDLYELIGTEVEEDMWELIKIQLNIDLVRMEQGENISLLAKWLKSANTSSVNSSTLGKLTAKKLGLSEKQYRKTLSQLRKYLNIVEEKMSSNDWTEINYQGVPSRAMKNYRKAFERHDIDGFNSYIESVSKGEAKINSSTLFPYDIFEGMELSYSYVDNFIFKNYDKVLEEQWKALPNYVDGENNVLIMADTSRSMEGRPICTALGLAIYFAERNQGEYKNKFMTFSYNPSFIELKGDTLYEKIKCIPSIVQNTDLEKAFRLILNSAIRGNIKPEEMPKSLIIISDMEFDQQTTNSEMTWHDAMVNIFSAEGYQMPNIIYWNVDSRNNAFQVTSDFKGVQLASGQSPSLFSSIIKNIGCTPYQAMVNTLSDSIYDTIIV